MFLLSVCRLAGAGETIEAVHVLLPTVPGVVVAGVAAGTSTATILEVS